jgi:hypothetical protein
VRIVDRHPRALQLRHQRVAPAPPPGCVIAL